jgi:hypothetical protein
MQTYIYGLISGMVGLSLDAILPIVFQEGNIEIYSFIFIMSTFMLLLTLLYLFLFNRNDLTQICDILKNKSTDYKIMLYGGIRYIKTLLMTFGLLFVGAGLFNTLYCWQLVAFSLMAHYTGNTVPNMFETMGYILTILIIGLISYSYVSKTSSSTSKYNMIYGIIALIIALSCDFIDSEYFAKLESNPFEDIFISSLAMFIIAGIILIYRTWALNIKFGVGGTKHFLYLLLVPIFICQYIPALLEFTTYDFATPEICMSLFVIQACLGFLLEKMYYKTSFSNTLILYILLLIIGCLFIIYGYLEQAKDTRKDTRKDTTKDTTSFDTLFKSMRNIKFFGSTKMSDTVYQI